VKSDDRKRKLSLKRKKLHAIERQKIIEFSHKKGKRRLLIAIIFYVLAGYVNAIFCNMAEQLLRASYIAEFYGKDRFILPDILFRLVPYVYIPHFPDYFLAVSAITAIIFTLTRSDRFVLLRRFMYCHALLMLMRSITVVATQFPDPNPNCHPTSFGTRIPRGIFEAFNPFFSTTCGDLMFSGHSVLFVLIYMLIYDYSNRNFFRYISFIWTCLGLLSLIAARYHYTIDVIIGTYLSVRIWRGYHWFAQVPELRQKFYDPVIEYMETDSDQEIELNLLREEVVKRTLEFKSRFDNIQKTIAAKIREIIGEATNLREQIVVLEFIQPAEKQKRK